jgi:hypothetical protein
MNRRKRLVKFAWHLFTKKHLKTKSGYVKKETGRSLFLDRPVLLNILSGMRFVNQALLKILTSGMPITPPFSIAAFNAGFAINP